jgi:hypothetical protein
MFLLPTDKHIIKYIHNLDITNTKHLPSERRSRITSKVLWVLLGDIYFIYICQYELSLIMHQKALIYIFFLVIVY